MKNICFGILVKTYKRKSVDNSKIVSRALLSILNQTYKNYKVFFIGDRYEDEKEFLELSALIPKDKIVAYNHDVALERESSSLRGENLWVCAGINTTRLGVRMMRQHGITHYARLDDDDFWKPNHLEVLSKGYNEFPEAVFVYTKSLFSNSRKQVPIGEIKRVLPSENVKLGYNNLIPRSARVVQSSTSWRLDKVSILPRYPHEQMKVFPADADMWDRFSNLCSHANLKVLHIPEVTVVKDFEGHIFNEK